MTTGSRSLQFVMWGLLALVFVLVMTTFMVSRPKPSNLPVYGEIRPFVLTNQLGQTVSLRDLKGKVWVADVIFTRCAGPCPKMTDEMSKLQAAFSPNDNVRFVTLTTDPLHDTPPVLKRYSEKFKADPERWFFLTGPKQEALENLAMASLKLAALEKEESERQDPNDLFIHSTQFVLVDKAGKLRGAYESLEPGFQEKIQADIRALLAEKP